MSFPRLAIITALVTVGACSLTGQPGSDVYGLFFKPDDHVEDLLDNRETWAAASIYDKEEAYFTEKADRKSVRQAVARLDEKVTAEFADMLSRHWDAIDVYEYKNWSLLNGVFASFDDLYTKSISYRIVYENKELNAQIGRAASQLKDLKAQFEAKAATAFVESAWRTSKFFEEYPVRVDKAATISRGWEQLIRRAGTKSFEANAKLWTDYLNGLSASRTTFISNYLWEQSCPSKSQKGLTLQLCRVAGMADQDLLKHKEVAAQAPILFVSALPAGVKIDWGKLEPLTIDSSKASAIAKSKNYVVFLGSEKGKEVGRREKTSQKISSEYLLTTKTLPNPAYLAQKTRVSQLQARYVAANNNYTIAQAQSNACVYYCTGVAFQALGASIALAAVSKELRTETGKLFGMSPTIEEPVYESYQITETVYDLTKSAKIKVVVYDTEGRVIQFNSVPVFKKKSATVYYNVHEKEHYKSRYSGTEQDLSNYFEKDLAIDATDLWDRLTPAQVKSNKRGKYETAFAIAAARSISSPSSGKSTNSAARSGPGKYSSLLNSVVIVSIPNTSIAAGFFVGRDLVLTNHHAVEDTRFVDIVLADGTSTFGKVLRSSPHTDLALIQINGSGVPVAFHTGKFGIGDEVVAVGHPKGLPFSVTRGIVSSVRSAPIGEPTSPPVKLIQTDTALNTGNSGGPLFIDGKVIGIVTAGFRKDISEGLSFAVHVEEIRKFLR